MNHRYNQPSWILYNHRMVDKQKIEKVKINETSLDRFQKMMLSFKDSLIRHILKDK